MNSSNEEHALEYENIVLTETDRLILNSYKVVLEGLADYLGEGYEFVLHDLENLDKSVIKIINGYHTGRQEGAPVTDLALSMLSKIKKNGDAGYISYYSNNNKGEPLKATTITICGERGNVIGLICINFYLNTSISDFLRNFTYSIGGGKNYIAESFADNLDELISSTVKKIKSQVDSDDSIAQSMKNKEIVMQLYNQGIFRLKDSVDMVAKQMDISKNTVYMHLRSLAGA